MATGLSQWFTEKGKFLGWLILLSGLGLGIFLLGSSFNAQLGFPLDDSWIHQTYARNLAELGEFSFIPGQPSAGSTSPLWTALLALGYALQMPHLLWTYLLGWLSLSLVAIMGGYFLQHFATAQKTGRLRVGNLSSGGFWVGSLWMGIFLATEWHLLWAAGSGMETLLYCGLILCIFVVLFRQRVNWFLAGLLVGISIWLRPDALTLLGPLCWVIFFSNSDWKDRRRAFTLSMMGFFLFMAPYLAFNQILAGSPWPNTFSAKQAEYAVLQQAAWLPRFLAQVQLPLVGAGAVLLPGIITAVYVTIKNKAWVQISVILWAIGFMGLYAWRLPVTYQHGRYIMPVMPVLFSLGMFGFLWAVNNVHQRFGYVIRRVWIASLVMTQVSFIFLGARAYSQEVGWIQAEMVQASKWIAEHTKPNDLIAAHDIGALGYYSQREILDLAGLITPEVIPFMQNEVLLAEYMDHNQVDYLMTFPSWYPNLVWGRGIVYQSADKLVYGSEPMTIYDWQPR